MTPRRYNRASGLCILCPITNQQKGYPFEVPIPSGHPVTGIVLADQAKSLSWQEHGAELVCAAPPAVTRETKGKLRALLQLQ
jgi:mRNA interferase MazF